MANRIEYLSLDVSKENTVEELIVIQQGENSSLTIHADVYANGEPLDLEGAMALFLCVRPDGTCVQDEAAIVQADGVWAIQYDVADAVASAFGKISLAYFELSKDVDGSLWVATTDSFGITVKKGVGSEQVTSGDEWLSISAIVAQMKQATQDALDAAQGIGDVASEAEAAVTAANDAAERANNAAANVKDGTSATHEWNGTVLTITSASGTSSADLKGEKGDTGAQGVQGPKGETGDTGPQGPQGVQGEQGPQGIQGEKGDTGAGFAVLDYYATVSELEAAVTNPEPGVAYGIGTAEPYDIYIYGETSGWVNNGPLQGAKGDKGDTGPQGPQGEQGVQGEQGPQGPAGSDATVTTESISAALGFTPQNISISVEGTALSITTGVS